MSKITLKDILGSGAMRSDDEKRRVIDALERQGICTDEALQRAHIAPEPTLTSRSRARSPPVAYVTHAPTRDPVSCLPRGHCCRCRWTLCPSHPAYRSPLRRLLARWL